MSVTTYHAPNGAAKAVATTLRNLGYVSPEPTGSGSQEAMTAEGSGPGSRTASASFFRGLDTRPPANRRSCHRARSAALLPAARRGRHSPDSSPSGAAGAPRKSRAALGSAPAAALARMSGSDQRWQPSPAAAVWRVSRHSSLYRIRPFIEFAGVALLN